MPKRPIQPEDLLRFKHVAEPRLQPDGHLILFSQKSFDANKLAITQLYSVDLENGSIQQWTQGEGSASGGRWSPDGRWISFVSKRGDSGHAQICLLPSNGGEGRALTSLPEGSIGSTKWSPDGRFIAFDFRATHPDHTVKAAEARKATKASQPPVVISSLWYRMDGEGYYGDQRFEVMVVDVQTGEVSVVYNRGEVDRYDFDWLQDSSGLLIAHGTFEENYCLEPTRDLLVRVLLSGEIEQVHVQSEIFGIKVSPDGESVAYLGFQNELDDRGDFNRQLWVLPVAGGEARCLTSNDDFCLSIGVNSDTKSDDGGGLRWSPDSRAIYANIGRHGAMDLAYIPVQEGGVRFLTEGEHLCYLGDISSDGELLVGTLGTATTLQEIAVFRLSQPTIGMEKLTGVNDAVLDEIILQAPASVWLTSTDDHPVQAWIMEPVRPDSKKKYPAVLEIHGGPHMMYGYSFMHEFQLLAAQGYYVVFSNPRGSKGYGEAHTAAIRNSWGVKDWEDIQTVTRWMQHHPNIHGGTMGVMGGSYGGYMTNWVIGHTNDFKAAITDRCVSNLVSKAGNSDYIWRPNGYWQGYAYGKWDKIETLWNQSPIAYFDQVQTPTLVIHSEGDLRCNIEQGEQVFAALQQRGIPSRFVRYPVSTSHGLSRTGPADLRLHRLGEILAWWKKYLG